MWKIYDNDDGQRTNLIRKAHLAFDSGELKKPCIFKIWRHFIVLLQGLDMTKNQQYLDIQSIEWMNNDKTNKK